MGATTFKYTLLILCSVSVINFKTYSQVENFALDFPGVTSSVVNLGNIDELDAISQFTFECWIKLSAWNTDSEVFNRTQDENNRIGIQLGPQDKKMLYFHIANGTASYVAVENVPVAIAQWHHIVMAYNGALEAKSQVDVYIDGVKMELHYMSESGLLPDKTATASSPVIVGQGFDGKIDEVRLWKTKLSASDIVLSNTIGDGHPLYSNLIGYWRMDQHTNNTSVIDYKADHHGVMRSGVERVPVDDNETLEYHVVGGYVRPYLYKAGAVSDDYLLHNNDIINLFVYTYDDGELFFIDPVSDGVLTNTAYLAEFSGRNGVVDFNGTGSKMNAGRHLMNNAEGGVTRFTFEAWVYLDSWVNWSYIFRNQTGSDWQNKIDLQLGEESKQQLFFHINNGGNFYAAVDNSGLSVGAWHHLAVVYNGGAGARNQAQLYLDGVKKDPWYSSGDGTLPEKGPLIRGDFELGLNFDGKMDEAMVFRFPLSQGHIVDHMNGGFTTSTWPNFWIAAHWKFDDASIPGKDAQTWIDTYNGINAAIGGHEGIKHRISATGDWRNMIKTPESRENFAQNLRTLLDNYPLFDGVDLDFEWCYQDVQCWTDYGKAVEVLNNALKPEEVFSVSLHPLSYAMPISAIELLDLVSIQSYGPRPAVFSYEAYQDHIKLFTDHGFPKDKLIAGLPFYGVSDPSGSSIGYDGIVDAFPALDPAIDQVVINRGDTDITYVFNGVNTIQKKVQYAKEQDLAGAMYWDTAVDTDYSHPLCLLKALNTEMSANIQVPDGSLVEIPEASLVEISHTSLPPLFDPDVVLGIDTVSGDGALLLYPNPATGYFNLQLPPCAGTGSIQVLDLNGKIRFSALTNGKEAVRLETVGFPAGLYVVKYLNIVSGKFASALLKVSL